ncbi:MAG: hypothetical protein SVX43_15395 [Cyanobacteriota bacterium]|nr:hypothetical protein [Cyanobacteriota bacterium]
MMSERKIAIDQSSASIGVGFAETVRAEQLGGTINNVPPEQRQNLAEAAAEIQTLLQQLEQSYPTRTSSEKQVVVTEALKQIESRSTLKKRLISAVRSGSIEVLKTLVQHPLVNILVAALEGWQDTE